MAYIQYVDGAEELYDIANDPHEWTNLAAKRPGVMKSMKKWIPKIDNGPTPGSRAGILTTTTVCPFGKDKSSEKTIQFLKTA